MRSTLKIDVYTEDQDGITLEVLQSVSEAKWPLLSMEMQPYHIYLHLEIETHFFDEVKRTFLALSAVHQVEKIPFLPTERRHHSLQSLFSHLNDPIADISPLGDIIVANASFAQLFQKTPEALENENINALLSLSVADIFNPKQRSLEVTVNRHSYFLDVSEVHNEGRLVSAILTLRSSMQVGQALSALHQQIQSESNIYGQSIAIQQAIEKTKRFANLNMPVLISGETGTGKELFARALHECSERKDKPFLAVNCAALPEHLLESELFGYASGAFSGAARSGKPGLFELANMGTVFLDEIGEMSVYLQAKLLRFLETYRFRRVGGTQEIEVDVRIVSATHRDLPHAVKQQAFRQDLFYRLNVLNLHLVPLRERKEDIVGLAQRFMLSAAEQTNTVKPRLSAKAEQALMHHDWPGNVRQLQNVMFRSVALATHAILEESDLQFSAQETSMEKIEQKTVDYRQFATWKEAQAAFETAMLEQFINEFPSTRKLAERLAVSHNKIAMKLKAYGINAKT